MPDEMPPRVVRGEIGKSNDPCLYIRVDHPTENRWTQVGVTQREFDLNPGKALDVLAQLFQDADAVMEFYDA